MDSDGVQLGREGVVLPSPISEEFEVVGLKQS